MKDITDLIGRIFLGSIFFFTAINKILYFPKTLIRMEDHGMTFMTKWLLLGAIFLTLFGSVLMFIGYRVKLAAFTLILFLIPATLFFHLDFQDKVQQIQFMKNLTILGGLFMVMSHGSGRYSVRRLLASTKI